MNFYAKFLQHPWRYISGYLLALFLVWAFPTFFVLRPEPWERWLQWAGIILQLGALVVLLVGGLIPIATWVRQSIDRLVQNKPIVVSNQVRDIGTNPSYQIQIQNIGNAFAVNVWLLNVNGQDAIALGSLGKGESRQAPIDLPERHVLIAEARPLPPLGRKFTPTMNLREGFAVCHGFIRLNDKALHHQGSLERFLELQPDLLTTLQQWSPRSHE